MIQNNLAILKGAQDNNMNKEKETNLDNINVSKISDNDNIQYDDLSKSTIIISSDFDIAKNIKVISFTFSMFHSDISGKDIKEEHPLNKFSIYRILFVFHLDKSGKEINDEQFINIESIVSH